MDHWKIIGLPSAASGIENDTMLYQFIRQKLPNLLRCDVRPHLGSPHPEPIFQGILVEQCPRTAIDEVFVPVGATANYSFLYFWIWIMPKPQIRHARKGINHRLKQIAAHTMQVVTTCGLRAASCFF